MKALWRSLGLLGLGLVGGIATSIFLVNSWVESRYDHFRVALIDVIETPSTHIHPSRSNAASVLDLCNRASDQFRLQHDKMYAGFLLSVGLHRALADEIVSETYEELSAADKLGVLIWGPDEQVLGGAHQRAVRAFRNTSRAWTVADWARDCGF